MIDPIHSLAFSIHANRGVYALLLGSGMSRAAKIPTGWEITLDLVRRLAAVAGEPCDPSPEQWYLDRFHEMPDYSDLLDALAKTPAERQQMLRGYWEATEQDREEGAKQPTEAHRAIAYLVAQGFVRVIITTNFDRLVENALNEAGIVPTVLSTADQIHGALPLIHTGLTLFKVHGDYLDTRIRNTPEELAAYPTEFDALLDRIFDEFGLVVCGWSADWDEALRNALMRAPSRRFATYWAAKGQIGEVAQRLIQHRAASVVQIDDGDAFFKAVQQHVQSLEEFSRPHPLSVETAVASLKRYLTEPRYRIQLFDLISQEVDRVIEATSGAGFEIQGGPAPDTALATRRVRGYEAACSTLLAMAVIGGFWGEKEHGEPWRRALQRLSTVDSGGGFALWHELQRYRGALLLYTIGLGAVEAGRLQLLGDLFATPIHREYRENISAVQLLPPFCLFEQGGHVGRILEGKEQRHAPLNDWLHGALRPLTTRIIPNENRYTLVFDTLEIMMALGFAHHAQRSDDHYWAPPGAFGYRHDNRDRIIQEIQESISSNADRSPFVVSGIFGSSAGQCTQALAAFSEFAREFGRRWW